MGKPKKKIGQGHGGKHKIRLFATKHVNVSDNSGKVTKVEILRVIKNPANVDYDRRGVITKGSTIETPLGPARVTSRPGQDGVINAILIQKKKL